jgi:4-carboxymuconolactone decarboxylase
MRSARPNLASAAMDPAEELLRRLALNDERVVGMVLTQPASCGPTELSSKVELLVRLAALLAVGGATPSLREAVAHASAAGATTDEIVGVLVSVGPTIGLASLVASAERLAIAIGYDLENGHGQASGSNPGNGRG